MNLTISGSVSLGQLVACQQAVRLVGENGNNYSGISVSSIGDLNGDGRPEVLIGAYGYANNARNGATYVVSGQLVATSLASGGTIALGITAGRVRLVGENTQDNSGYSVSSIGDLNGDGRPEVLIGAQGYASGKGATYVVSGQLVNSSLASGGTITLGATPGMVRLIGENNLDFSGYSVSSIGDLNGDGRPEVLIGAQGYTGITVKGATYVVSGQLVNSSLASGGNIALGITAGMVRLVGENGNDYSGISVSSIGDLNGDGRPEVLIGAYGYAFGARKGATYVVSGQLVNSSLASGGNIALGITAGMVRLVGENNSDYSGTSVSSIGDLNGDGRPEVLIGANYYASFVRQGATYVVSGQLVATSLASGDNIALGATPGIVRLVGENNFDFSGYSVSSIGDLNGDGRSEVLIGANSYASDARQGATYVVSGQLVNSSLASGGTIALGITAGMVRLVGENTFHNSGYSVSSIGDLNGDGRPEVLIGAYTYSAGGIDNGATYVVFDLSCPPSPSDSPSVTNTRSVTTSTSNSYSASPSDSPSMTVSPSVTTSASNSYSARPSDSPSVTNTGSVTTSTSNSYSASPSDSSSITISPSVTTSASNSYSASPSDSPSMTVSPSVTASTSNSYSASPSTSPSTSGSVSSSHSLSLSISSAPSDLPSPSSSYSSRVSQSTNLSHSISNSNSWRTSNPVSANRSGSQRNSVSNRMSVQTSAALTKPVSLAASPFSTNSLAGSSGESINGSPDLSLISTAQATANNNPSISASHLSSLAPSISPSIALSTPPSPIVVSPLTTTSTASTMGRSITGHGLTTTTGHLRSTSGRVPYTTTGASTTGHDLTTSTTGHLHTSSGQTRSTTTGGASTGDGHSTTGSTGQASTTGSASITGGQGMSTTSGRHTTTGFNPIASTGTTGLPATTGRLSRLPSSTTGFSMPSESSATRLTPPLPALDGTLMLMMVGINWMKSWFNPVIDVEPIKHQPQEPLAYLSPTQQSSLFRALKKELQAMDGLLATRDDCLTEHLQERVEELNDQVRALSRQATVSYADYHALQADIAALHGDVNDFALPILIANSHHVPLASHQPYRCAFFAAQPEQTLALNSTESTYLTLGSRC